MKIEKRKLSELSLDPKNARKHNKKNLEAIKGSLTKFGQQKPIVVTKENVIIAGNGTYAAAKELGWTEIDVVISTLDAVNQKAFALADNRTAELAEWDDSFLTETLKSLGEIKFDLGSIGFDESFVKGHVRSEPGENDDVVPDVAKNAHNVKRGQIWKLGEHRLMCGNSMCEEHFAALMGGKKPDSIVTDPPYGIAYKSPSGKGKTKRGNYDVIKGDDKPFDPTFMLELAPTLVLWGANHFADSLPRSACWLVWDKREGDAINNNSDCELAWVNKGGSARLFHHKWNGMIKASEKNEKRVHPTQKPFALISWIFETVACGENVVDLFGGSGSTLIACEKTNRTNFSMELDEHYCSVIIERWQQFTGKKAELLKLN